MIYKYVAYQPDGRIVRGSVEAVNEERAEQTLAQAGSRVISLAPSPPRRLNLDEVMPTFFGVKRQDVIIFSRQLATLLEAGVPLLNRLTLLTEQAGEYPLSRVLAKIIEDLRTGGSLSHAVRKHPFVFPPLYARMIDVGERMGNPERILGHLAAYLEREQAVAARTTKALAYPATILVMALGVAALMIFVTLPPILRMFQEFKSVVPPATRFLIALLEFFQRYGVFLVLALAVITAIAVWYVGQPEGRRRWHLLLLKAPVFGPIVADSNLARVARMTSVLARGGVPLLEAMELTGQLIGNVVLRDALRRVGEQLSLGQGLAEPMSRNGLFPPMMVTMVRIGEESGTLDTRLETVADFLEAAVERRTEFLTSLIEPGLTIVVGLVIAFMAIAVIMPMFSLTTSVR